MTLLAGNLLSLAGCLLMVSIGFVTKKERILYLQCVQCGLMGGANAILGAGAGAVANLLSVARNLLFAKRGGSPGWKVFFIAVQVALTLRGGMSGWLDWLPIVATAQFTWFLDTKRDETLKLSCVVGQAMWTVYDFSYRNYAAFVFDLLTLGSNAVGLARLRGKKAEISD